MNPRIIHALSCILLLTGILLQGRSLISHWSGASKPSPVSLSTTPGNEHTASLDRTRDLTSLTDSRGIPRISLLNSPESGGKNSDKLQVPGPASALSAEISTPLSVRKSSESTQETPLAPGAAEKKVFTEGITAFPLTFNPLLAMDSNSNKAIALIYASLVRYDSNLHLAGDLADSWLLDREKGTLVFNLRTNAQWHDGSPVIAEDVKETFEAAWRLRRTGKMPAGLDMVKQVTVIDEKTISVEYRSPWARMLDIWTLPILSARDARKIFPEDDAVQTKTSFQGIESIPMGSGPFIPSSTDGKGFLELIGNSHYHLGKPNIDIYRLKVIRLEENSTEWKDLDSVDLVELPAGFDPDGSLERENNLITRDFQSNDCEWLWLNLNSGALSNREFRTALAMAVDRPGLLKDLGTRALLANGPFLPLSWASDPDIMLPEYDLQAARTKISALAQSGLALEPLTIITDKSSPWRGRAAERIAQDWLRCGLVVRVEILPWEKIVNRISSRDFSVLLVGFEMGMDPDQASLWHSSEDIGLNNISSFRSTQVDTLIEQGRNSLSNDSRRGIYQKLHGILARELPCIYLFNPYRRYALSPRARSITLGKLGHRTGFHDWNPEQ